MGNLYRLNSLFEIEISEFPDVPLFDKGLLERSHILEYLFLVISKEKDYTFFSKLPSKELIEYWEKNKIRHGNIIQTDNFYYSDALPINKKLKDFNLVEWGKTSRISSKDSLIQKKDQTIFQSKFINSKLNQSIWKDNLKINTLNTVLCTNETELEYCLSCMSPPFVIKPELSFAGRGNIILRTKDDFAVNQKRIDSIFRDNPNGILVEEWVEEQKLLDFSGIFELSSKVSKLLAVTKMLVDKSGVYRGSIIQKKFGESLIPGLQNVAKNTQRFNTSYSGPFSIDGFAYKKDYDTEYQFMSEINYRYSMGRILYDLNEKIGTKQNDYALIFLPIKTKTPQYKSVISNLGKIEKEFSAKVLLLTPLSDANNKTFPFAIFYINTQKDFPMKIIESIKKVIS